MLPLLLGSNRCGAYSTARAGITSWAYFQHWVELHSSCMFLGGDATGAVMSFARECDFATLPGYCVRMCEWKLVTRCIVNA